MTNTRTALATLAIAVSLTNPLLAQFAYVANVASNDVSGYTINAPDSSVRRSAAEAIPQAVPLIGAACAKP
jgi:hypothetical protein